MATVRQEQEIDEVADSIIETVDNDENSSFLMNAFGELGFKTLHQRMDLTEEVYASMREAICGTLRKYLK